MEDVDIFPGESTSRGTTDIEILSSLKKDSTSAVITREVDLEEKRSNYHRANKCLEPSPMPVADG